MKILITGHKGFIGTHLYNHFDKKYSVVGMDIKCDQDIRNKDLCDFLTEGVDIVIHMAAMNSVPRSYEVPEEVYSHNVVGFATLLKSAEKNKVKKFIYASSSAASTTKPMSPYGLSKQINEQHCRFTKLHTVGLRFFNIYGKGQRSNGPYAPVIAKWLNQNPVTIFGDGNQIRCFTHVSDVVKACEHYATTETPFKHTVYDVRAKPITILDLAKLMNKDVEYYAKRKGDLQFPLMNKDWVFNTDYKNLKDGLCELQSMDVESSEAQQHGGLKTTQTTK